MLGVHGKLVKYVVHSSKRKKINKNYFSSHKLPKQQSTSFWSQGILGVKGYTIEVTFDGRNSVMMFKSTKALKPPISVLICP
jgi:hypothetical protein